MKTWQPGESLALRGMYNGRPWYVQSVLMVKDSPREVVLLLLPGAECAMPSGYIHQKHGEHSDWQRWQEMLNPSRELEKFNWQTNRLLILLELGKFFATIFFWNHTRDEFKCYYINFQLPFECSRCGFDTLDLELDLVINPDFQWHWKDDAEYQEGIRAGVIQRNWSEGIENAKKEIFERIENRQYPLNADWLSWKPDPIWTAPQLPAGWEV